MHDMDPAAVQRMLNEWQRIADLDDAEITPWQRQLRVNKTLLEMNVRKMITSLTDPVIKSQQDIERELQNIVQKRITEVIMRVESLEFDVYGKKGRDDKIQSMDRAIKED